MSDYYFWALTYQRATPEQEAEINKRVAEIDPTATFIVLDQPGNDTHGYLSRPNDGTNEYNYRRKLHAECTAVVISVLLSDVLDGGVRKGQ